MKKNKLIKLFSVTLVVFFSISVTNTVKAYDTFNDTQIDSTIELNTLEVKKTIIGYLSNKWEEAKQSKIIENKYIVSNTLQEKYDSIKSNYENKWRQGIDEKIQWYSLDLNINSIDIVADSLKVDTNVIINFKYENLDVTSSLEENHIIYLKKINGNLLVEKDICDDNFTEDNYLTNKNIDFSKENEFYNYITKKIEETSYNLEMVDSYINKYKSDMETNKKSLFIQDRAYSAYNGSAAAAWALNHVYDTEVWEDNNCTYFVSSALNAGGLPMDETWYKDKYCGAWIRVIELRNWLLNKGYATETLGIAYGNEGDVIQLFNATDQVWSHSLIVTYTNHRYGNCYVSAHSKPAHNVSIRNYYPNPKYSNVRTLKLS